MPVVLTVASPAALARSSFLACIARGESPEGVGPFALDKKADNLYREEIEAWRISPVPRQPSTDASGVRLPPANEETLYRRILESANGVTFARLDVVKPRTFHISTGQLEKFTRTEVPVWQLVYFDPEDASKTGEGLVPNGGVAVSRSCYSSFMTQP